MNNKEREDNILSEISRMKKEIASLNTISQKMELNRRIATLESFVGINKFQPKFIRSFNSCFTSNACFINREMDIMSLFEKYGSMQYPYENLLMKFTECSVMIKDATCESYFKYLNDFASKLPSNVHLECKSYIDNFDRNHLFLGGKKYGGGCTVVNHYANEALTKSKTPSDLNSYLEFFHEFGHAVEYYKSPMGFDNDIKTLYSEISSLFMEMLSTIDAEKHLLNSDKTYKDILTLLDFEIGSEVFVYDKLAIMASYKYENYKTPNYMLLYEMYKRTDTGILDFLVLLTTKIKDNAKYTLSYFYAIELFMIYMEDPEYAFYLLERYMIFNPRRSEEINEFFDKIGLTPLKSYSEYQRKYLIK